MKSTVSLFALLAFFIIGFIHNPMMSFAMWNNWMSWMNNSMDCHNMAEKNTKVKTCCISSAMDIKYFWLNINLIKNYNNISKNLNNFDIFWINLFSFENNNLIKKHHHSY